MNKSDRKLPFPAAACRCPSLLIPPHNQSISFLFSGGGQEGQEGAGGGGREGEKNVLEFWNIFFRKKISAGKIKQKKNIFLIIIMQIAMLGSAGVQTCYRVDGSLTDCQRILTHPYIHH